MENLEAWNKDGHLVCVEERKSLLARIRAESEKNGDAALAVRCFHLILIDSHGRLLIVQRGDKADNPFLWDKTAGGHVQAGESFKQAIRRELAEELGLKIHVTDSHELYHEIMTSYDLQQTAVARLIDFLPWGESMRLTREGGFWRKRDRRVVCIGRYYGNVRFVDGEAQAIQRLDIGQIRQAIKYDPQAYTFDLQHMVENYAYFLT